MHKVFSRPHIDLALLLAIVPLFLAGLITMRGLGADAIGQVGANYFFNRQIVWIAIGFILFFAASSVDWRVLRSGQLLLVLYASGIAILAGLLILASAV